jgi:cyclase
VLLLQGRGLVKTRRFKDPTYLGDPINVARIFNDKEVDEMVFLDIRATAERRSPPLDILRDLASECFMPLGYGGGIRTLADVKAILELGVEKVSLNTAALENPELITEAAAIYGSQSVVASLDVKRDLFGRPRVYTRSGKRSTGRAPLEVAKEMESRGAGEILLNSIERDGVMKGYDLDLTHDVASAVSIPVIACGGAGSVSDLVAATQRGRASAVAAGSLFVFQGPHRAVMISYPSEDELQRAFATP